MVGVLGNTTAHTGGVVVEDTTNECCCNGSRIWTQFTIKWLQSIISIRPDNATIYANGFAIAKNFNAFKAIISNNQHILTRGLTGQGGTSGPEANRCATFIRQANQLNHFFFAISLNDYFWHIVVAGCINTVGITAQIVRIDAVFNNMLSFLSKTLVIFL